MHVCLPAQGFIVLVLALHAWLSRSSPAQAQPWWREVSRGKDSKWNASWMDTSHEFCKHRLIALGRLAVHTNNIHTSIHTQVHTYSIQHAAATWKSLITALPKHGLGDMTLPAVLLCTFLHGMHKMIKHNWFNKM